jgi:cyclophilin family peptidyl-prolyl cis-trans isomerase
MRQILAMLLLLAALAVPGLSARQAKPGADPVLVLETVKGLIEIRLLSSEAPKSVEHIVALVKRSFYRGQRIHRVTASLVQFGDLQSRDMTRQGVWGTRGSGKPIGVFEAPRTRRHLRGTVGLAHSGDGRGADSQLYIMKAASPSLDGKHAIVGQVVTGMAIVDRLAVTDMIRNTTLK